MRWLCLDIEQYLKETNTQIPEGYRQVEDNEIFLEHKTYRYWSIYKKPSEKLSDINEWGIHNRYDWECCGYIYKKYYAFYIVLDKTKLGNVFD